MRVEIESFSFLCAKHIHSYDYVVDARILDFRGRGVQWQTETGLDAHVIKIAEEQPELRTLIASAAYFAHTAYLQGRKLVKLGIGCLHGRHRSVVVAEGLAVRLRQLGHDDVSVRHRQLDKAE